MNDWNGPGPQVSESQSMNGTVSGACVAKSVGPNWKYSAIAIAVDSPNVATVNSAGSRPFTLNMAMAPHRITETSGARSIHLSHAKSVLATALTKWSGPTSA